MTQNLDDRGTLTDLHEKTRRMMSADTVDDIAGILQETTVRLLGANSATILEDDQAIPRAFGASPLSESLRDAFRGVAAEAGTETGLVRGTVPLPDGSRSTYVAHRLGDHGTLIVLCDANANIDEASAELVRILATNAEVALDRAAQIWMLKDREQDLIDERNRLAALFENVPSPTASFVIENGEPVVESVNPAFEAVFGYEQSELVGECIDDYIVPPDHEREADQYNDLLREGRNVNVEVQRMTTDGPRDFLLDVVPFQLNAPNLHGYAVYTDITERKQREQELKRQNERLEEFASIVSHDIRNPLNVAQGFIEVARQNPDDAYFDRVENALDRVNDIVESVLTMAREGRPITDPEPTNLSDTANGAWQHVATASATLVVESSADRFVAGNPTRLTTFFENLFRNSVEHGSADVTVTVGVLEDDAGFFVADDGPGIPPSVQDRIFESGFTTRESGTGFGLAIVKEVAEAHDWTIECGDQSEGARFEIRGVEWCDGIEEPENG